MSFKTAKKEKKLDVGSCIQWLSVTTYKAVFVGSFIMEATVMDYQLNY